MPHDLKSPKCSWGGLNLPQLHESFLKASCAEIPTHPSVEPARTVTPHQKLFPPQTIYGPLGVTVSDETVEAPFGLWAIIC